MNLPLPAETLLLEGADAPAFAHAQFSSAVKSLAVDRWQFSAWLDPRGRVLALFHLARLADDRYLLLLRGGSAAVMAEALRRFVFRSKVRITALPPRHLASGPALAQGSLVTGPAGDDDGDVSFGCDSHSLRISSVGDDAWRLQQLRAGWPWLPESCLGELLPPAISLQRLQAVVVDKGCYPGQEIVARLHFRGGHKRHMHRVTLSQAENAGDVLRKEEHDIGRVLDVIASDSEFEALVILSDELVAEANDRNTLILDDGVAMTLLSSWPS
jgi:folate-binding protein YgfZ